VTSFSEKTGMPKNAGRVWKFPSATSSLLAKRRRIRAIAAGMTLIELVVVCAIMMVLATAAIPLARMTIKRRKEDQLRYALREMRDAIDRYKDYADQGKIQVQAGTEGYPTDLNTLVIGVKLAGQTSEHRIRFLRSIPKDPMTGGADWGLRSVQDDPDSTSWGGQDVFDVYSRSTGTAMNGTRYSDW
jgi:general secretion pathway protein G